MIDNFAWYVAAVVALCGLGLFLAGMLSAALEVRAERRAGVPVTRPGWDSLRGYYKALRGRPLATEADLDASHREDLDLCDHGELAPERYADDPSGQRTGRWYCVGCGMVLGTGAYLPGAERVHDDCR